MKTLMMNMAGVKSEKEFYKKFPDEASFMKVHGKAFKKALLGVSIEKAQNGINYTFGQQMQVPQLGYNLSGDQTKPIFNLQGQVMTTPSIQQTVSTGNIGKSAGNNSFNIGDISNYAQPLGDVIGGFQAWNDETKKKREAYQSRELTNVLLANSRVREQPAPRYYTRPEDIAGQDLFPVYGTGTEVLGKYGVEVPKAENGLVDFMNKGGSDLANNLTTAAFDYNAGQRIGKGIGSAVKVIPGIGPVVSAIAEPVAGFIGGAIDELFGPAGKIKQARKATQRNITNLALNQGAQSVQNQYASYMEEGGNINPQIIKTAGGIPLKDFKRIALEGMDTLRTGGNIRQNTMNGDLQIYNGGAEPISYNPYLPDGGETVEFKGPSHAEGGMDVAYGRNPVEVEGGEPAVKLNDGGSASNLVVFGNLKDPRTGIKFKKEAKDISKKEDKANKTIRKSIEQIGEMDVITPYDRITYDTLKVMADASDTKLKKYAEQKQDLAAMQEAINSTAEEMNLSAEHLAEGKIKTAKKGVSISKAQEGESIHPYGQIPPTIVYEAMQNLLPYLPNTQKVPYRYLDQMETALPTKEKPASGKKAASLNSKTSPDKTISDVRSALDEYLKNRNVVLPAPGDLSTINPNASIDTEVLRNASPEMRDIPQEREGEGRYPLVDFANAILPYFRPTNAEPLDTRQLMGEMYALSQNRVEPVQAQGYHPLLEGAPPSISLESDINKVISQSKGLKKLAQYNPALVSDIASRTYEAINEIKGKEAMLNWTQKNEAYNRNRLALNDAQLKNLGIADTQYGRQEQAKSNTKETALAALNSISDKYQKNKLENKTLQAYENLYNYRYDTRGRAINLNPLAQWNLEGTGAGSTRALPEGYEYIYNQRGEAIDVRKIPASEKVTKASSSKRNGAIVKAINNL